MAKRDRSESSQNLLTSADSRTKRVKPNASDAISTLLESSEELIHCLNSLKGSGPSSSLLSTNPTSHLQLALVCKKLLPSFQALASQVDEAQAGTGHNAHDAVPVPSQMCITKWTSSEIPESLPPLPAIPDPLYEKAALTHQAILRHQDSIGLSYERLEFMGDAYIELIASILIHQTFPDLGPGKSSLLRELLVRNATLTAFSQEYGLDKRARLPTEFYPDEDSGGPKVSAKERKKVLGDLFEAYVAAVILSDPEHGVSRAAAWLKAIWSMKIADKIRDEERRQDAIQTPQGAGDVPLKPMIFKRTLKEELAHKLVVKGITLRYEDLPPPKEKDRDHKLQLFTVGVYLDGWGQKGLLLGIGTGTSKKEAGAKAAEKALGNKQLMKIYGGKKQAFLAASGTKPEVQE